ncbi:MAG: hypothetical protein QOH06_4302 [Acidobacteriota bacterium]|jgi:hypothetical protein|nr:hypothetical protein [Acidobacteriota bacterium]
MASTAARVATRAVNIGSQTGFQSTSLPSSACSRYPTPATVTR